MAKGISWYMHTVKRQLKRCGDRHGEYYAVFSQEVDTYCADHPNASPAEIKSHFGSPAAQASEFLQTLSHEELREKIISRSNLFSFLKIVLAVLAAAVIVLLSLHVADTWKFTHGHWEESAAQSGPSESNSDALLTY